MDWREGEKYTSAAVHYAHSLVGRGNQVEACQYGRSCNARAGEEGLPAGSACRSSRQGKIFLVHAVQKLSLSSKSKINYKVLNAVE